MRAKGLVHKYGDNVDTDVIIPARYLNVADMKELSAHCMEDIDAEFVNKVKVGDIMACATLRDASVIYRSTSNRPLTSLPRTLTARRL